MVKTKVVTILIGICCFFSSASQDVTMLDFSIKDLNRVGIPSEYAVPSSKSLKSTLREYDSLKHHLHKVEYKTNNSYRQHVVKFIDSLSIQSEVSRQAMLILLQSEIVFIGNVITKLDTLEGCCFFKTMFQLSIDSILYTSYNYKEGDTIIMASVEGIATECTESKINAVSDVSGYDPSYSPEHGPYLFGLSNLNYMALIAYGSDHYNDKYSPLIFSDLMSTSLINLNNEINSVLSILSSFYNY